MEYAQLNESKTEAIQITTHGNVEWDATHFCPASALTSEEAAQFRVVPLTITERPAFDPITQTVMRNGCELAGGAWQYRWDVVERFATQAERNAALAAVFAAKKTEALVRVDADTDALYGAVLGNRAEEYTLAANEAQAYKTAGYTGAVPASVQSWATAKIWTTQQAADDILLTAAQWVGAQSAIRAQRLLRKEQVRAATDAAGITAAMTGWSGFVVYMRGQLGIA